MVNYNTTLFVYARATLVRVWCAFIEGTPEIVSKIINIAERTVLAWEAYSITFNDLVPIIVSLIRAGFCWLQ